MTTSKTKVLDFSGQTIFIGLDVHTQSWSVTLQSEEFELKTFSQPPKPAVLINYLNENYPGAAYKAVYEAGFCGFHIQRALALQGSNAKLYIRPMFQLQTKKNVRRPIKLIVESWQRCLRITI